MSQVTFNGDRALFQAYQRAVIVQVRATSQFALRTYLGETEYERRGEPEVAIYPNPGTNPPGDALQFQQWKFMHELYTTQLGESDAALAQIIGGQGPMVISRLRLSEAHVPLGAMRERLAAAFGVLTREELVQAMTNLSSPILPNQSMTERLDSCRDIHAAFAASGQLLPEFSKVQALQAALLPAGVYSTALQHFTTTYPHAVDQTFERLASIVQDAADSGHLTITSATSGYASAVTAAAESKHADCCQPEKRDCRLEGSTQRQE